MAFESRRLIFSEEELISAALEFCHHDRIPLPDAEVESVEYVSNEDPSLILHFRVSCPMELDQVVLSGEQLVTALAMFCKREEIPLPALSEKRVRCDNGKIALQFELMHRIRCNKSTAIV
jgi:hypothetical protein